MTTERTTETPGTVSVRQELLKASVAMSRASAILAEKMPSPKVQGMTATSATAALELAQGAAALAKAGMEISGAITIPKENAAS